MRHRLDKDILFQKFIVEDKSASTVAEELNTTVSSVYYHLSKFSIRKGVLKHGKYVFLHVTEEEFERLYTSGMTLMNMAKEFQCCYQSIVNYLKRRNKPRRINGNDNSGLKDALYDLYINQLKSTTEISKILGLPKSRIRQAILQNNIKMRNKSECQQIFNAEYNGTFGNDWSLCNDALIKKVRRYCSNHVIPLVNKEKCIDCGSKEHLHVHHLVSLSGIVHEIKDENPGKTDDELYDIIINDKRFLDMSNLVVVCRDCHYTKYHPYAQYHSNAVSQSETKAGKNSSKAQRLSKAPSENREASRVVASATKCEGSGEPEHEIV